MQKLGVDVEESAPVLVADAAPPFDDLEFVEFAVAGARVAGEFRCTDCGYGAVVHRSLPQCPMCGGTIWASCGPRFVD